MKVVYKILVFGLSLLYLFSTKGYAYFDYHNLNQRWTYENYTEGVNKLASNVCYKMVIDAEGYLWVATNKGLQVYNGQTFESVNTPGNDGEIVSLFRDGPYLIGMSYYGDIIYIHTHTRKMQLLRDFQPPRDLSNNMFKNFVRRRDGRLYFLRYAGPSFSIPATDFYHREQDKFAKIRFLGKEAHPIQVLYDAILERYSITDTVMAAAVRKELHVPLQYYTFYPYGFSVGQHYYFRDQDSGTRWQHYTRLQTRKDDYIISTLPLPGETWVSWRFYGLDRIRRDGNMYHSYAQLFKGICVSNMLVDAQDNIWMSTLSNGLLKIDTQTIHPDYLPCTDPKRFYSTDIHYIDLSGDTLTLGYRKPLVDQLYRGQHLFRYTGDTIADNSSTGIFYGGGGGPAYLSSTEGNLYSFASDRQPGKLVETVIKDAYVQEGVYTGVSKRIHYLQVRQADMHLDTIPLHLAGIAKGNLLQAICSAYPDSGWYIANSKGLYRNQNPVSYGSNNRILKLRNFDGNIVLVSSQQVFLKRKDTGGFTPLGSLEGKDLKQLGWDPTRQCIYLLGNNGIIRYSLEDRASVLFLSNYELPAATKINCFYIDEHQLWVGTTQGIYKIPKEKLTHQLPFRLYIVPQQDKPNQALLDTLSYTYSGKLDIPLSVDILDYANDQYYIQYTIYDARNQVYKAGIAGRDRTISLGAFPPGIYAIKISAFQRYGYLEKEIRLTILPLWWQKKWVQLSGLLLLVGGVVGLTTYILKKRNRLLYNRLKNQHELLLVKNKLQSSRLKPHFIFNALNPLQKYILENNQEAALRYFEQFSKLMRSAIRHFEIDLISLEEELLFLQQYIYVQQCRYPNRFSVSFDLDTRQALSALWIPAMILQPILENAIEHGFTEGGHNYIGFSVREDTNQQLLSIIIENSGSRYPDELRFNEHHGMGIVIHKIALIAGQYKTGEIHFQNGAMGAQCTITLSSVMAGHYSSANP